MPQDALLHGVLSCPTSVTNSSCVRSRALKELLADWKLLLAVAGGSLAAILLIVYAFVRPAVDVEAEERKRRLHLNLIGRIAEGQVVELAEHPAPVVEA